MEIIREEEDSFSSMLTRGIKELNDRADKIKEEGGTTVDGATAFFLYDTMGFPLDLTTLMAREQGLAVDEEGFAAEMEAQKERSRAAAKAARGGEGSLALETNDVATLMAKAVPFTDDAPKYEWAPPSAPSVVQAILTADGLVPEASEGAAVGVVLDTTSFYGEAGGQVADVGTLVCDDAEVDVTHVQSYGGYVLHVGVLKRGSLTEGAELQCHVAYETRKKVAPNHTLTHLLNSALVDALGDGVSQKGSLVDAAKLRFDFSHGSALKPAELAAVEASVRKAVADSLPVFNEVVPLEKAKGIAGLRAVFGETYPDPVRVVSVGSPVGELLGGSATCASVEFCGGTHLTNTAEAGAFALIEETAVAKGIRRVTAVTGDLAREALDQGEAFQAELAQMKPEKAALNDFKDRLDAAVISAHVKVELRAQLEGLNKQAAAAAKAAANAIKMRATKAALDAAEAAMAAGESFIVLELEAGLDGKAAQGLMKELGEPTDAPPARLALGTAHSFITPTAPCSNSHFSTFCGVLAGKSAPTIAFLAFSADVSGDKLSCFASVPKDVEGLAANEWVTAALEPCGGRGGGKKESAQGTAPGVDGIDAALDAARSFASGKL